MPGENPAVGGHFAEQIMAFILDKRANNRPLTHGFSPSEGWGGMPMKQFASRLGKPQAKCGPGPVGC
ncbi:hypothetical protein BN1007_70260 [Klebsiella variicola]|nr:hypothetical protein BN1007_70260 [Klebsiella variicola]